MRNKGGQRWLNDATCNGLIIGTLGVNKFRPMSCNRALMTGPLNTVSCIVLYILSIKS